MVKCVKRKATGALIVSSILVAGLVFTIFYSVNHQQFSKEIVNVELPPDVGQSKETVTHDLVPNIVHFIRFGTRPMTYVEAVCILAALKNQNPDLVMLHSDQRDFDGGKYWSTVKGVGGRRILVLYRKLPSHAFGQQLNRTVRQYHGGDLARLQVLMDFGGIYLDNDCYIVKSLDEFRNFEMTLSAPDGNIQNQVIIARRDARFLKLWLKSYQNDYHPESWNYNAQIKPGALLQKNPHMVHRMKDVLLPPVWEAVFPMIYLRKSDEWRQYHAIHLFINHQYQLHQNLSKLATYPVEFNHENILYYDVNIKQMALEVWPKCVQAVVTA